MAILDHNNVIFYHPCDEINDTFLNESWTGSGQFPIGKIENAYAALPGEVLEQGSMTTLASGTADMRISNHGISIVNYSRFIFAYASNEDSTKRFKVRSGSVTSSGIIFNSSIDLDTFSDANLVTRIAKINGSGFIVIWENGSAIKGCPITISGNAISSGVTVTINSASSPFAPDIRGIDETRALVSWGYFAGSFPDREARCCIVQTSGNTLDVGSAVNIYTDTDTGVPYTSLDKLDENKMLAHWVEAALGRTRACTITTSGLTPSINDIAIINSGLFSPLITAGVDTAVVSSVDTDKFLTTFIRRTAPSGERGPYTQLCTISGTTIDLIGDYILWSETAEEPVLAMSKISDSLAIIHRGAINGASTKIRLVNISGVNISYGNILTSNIDFGQTPTGADVAVDVLNQNLILIGGAQTDGLIQLQYIFIDRNADIFADNTNAYPSTSGSTRIVDAAWVRMLTVSKSEARISRGYEIFLDKNNIQLLDPISLSGINWSGTNITSLMNDINNGNPHLIVADFENDSGGDWILSTSLDGSGFINQGIQNSGSLFVVNTITTPTITLSNHDPSGWVDENVLWGGDKNTFDKFTNQELSDLYNLGFTQNLAMPFFTFKNNNLDIFINGYEIINKNIELFINSSEIFTSLVDLFINGFTIKNDNIDLSIDGLDSIFGTLDLFISGPRLIIDNINLFIRGNVSGTAPSVGDDNFGITLDQLFKNADYNPQIIGRFIGDPNSVTIEVWDNDGNVIILTDNNCYQIGDTGRWAFSTVNLSPLVQIVSQFVYRMTGDNLETFESQFILHTRRKDSHGKVPRDNSQIRKV